MWLAYLFVGLSVGGLLTKCGHPPSHRIRWNITPQGGIRRWWGLIWVILPKYLLVLSREWMGMGEWDDYSGMTQCIS